MRKFLSCLAAGILTLGTLAGCGSNTTTTNEGTGGSEAQLKIVATIFPEYDWVRNILGDEAENADITLLMNNGTDMHNFQPTAEDIMKISSADLFIYVGGESDSWVDGALKEAVNKKMQTINLMEVLGDTVQEEEIVEGMQEEEHEDEHEEEETEYDEHVWLSLRNAMTICDAITDRLSDMDSGNADIYQKNNTAYQSEMTALDQKFREAVDASENKTLLFADRFPFRYFVDDYGLSYYAAFSGCSAETEASFETITFLAGKVDELNLPYVLTIEKSDESIAKTIIQNTKEQNRSIAALDSMQSVTAEDIEGGMSYLSVMESNLETLTKVLN